MGKSLVYCINFYNIEFSDTLDYLVEKWGRKFVAVFIPALPIKNQALLAGGPIGPGGP